MKNWLLRYGFILLFCIFVLIAIIMVSPLGPKISRTADSIFTQIKESPIAQIFKTNETMEVETEDMYMFTVTIHSKKNTDQWVVNYKYRDSSGI